MYKKIMVVVTSEGNTSREAIKESVAVARVHGAEIVFFHVLPRYVLPVGDMPMVGIPLPDEFDRDARANGERLLVAAAAVAEAAGVRSQPAMGSGDDDAKCIIAAALARHCGLIVVASAGRNALMRILMGSVIPGLITSSPVPVLVCRKASAHRNAGGPVAGRSRPRDSRAARVLAVIQRVAV